MRPFRLGGVRFPGRVPRPTPRARLAAGRTPSRRDHARFTGAVSAAPLPRPPTGLPRHARQSVRHQRRFPTPRRRQADPDTRWLPELSNGAHARSRQRDQARRAGLVRPRGNRELDQPRQRLATPSASPRGTNGAKREEQLGTRSGNSRGPARRPGHPPEALARGVSATRRPGRTWRGHTRRRDPRTAPPDRAPLPQRRLCEERPGATSSPNPSRQTRRHPPRASRRAQHARDLRERGDHPSRGLQHVRSLRTRGKPRRGGARPDTAHDPPNQRKD